MLACDCVSGPSLCCPAALSFASCPAHVRRWRECVLALRNTCKPVELIEGAAYNHFELLETLANPYGLMGRAMLEQMKLVEIGEAE